MRSPLVSARMRTHAIVVAAIGVLSFATGGRRWLPLWGAAATLYFGLLGLLRLRRFLSAALEGYPDVPEEGGVVMTGSVSSTVTLDYDLATAEKRYNHATRLVKLLYWLSFQGPFPYTSNEASLEAARHRRTITGLLTKYWFGTNLVAPVLDVRRGDDGVLALVTELVPGHAPTDLPRARALLRDLTTRFLEAGLPVWQVAHYNPRSIGNLIECADGSFRIIDLESNFVTPFLPPAALLRAVRIGQYPSFDDIDLGRLRHYLAAHSDDLERALGTAELEELRATVDAYEEAVDRWQASEPRLWGRAMRLLCRPLSWPGRFARLRRVTNEG